MIAELVWHLTQAAGRAFWRMTPAAQCMLVDIPGLSSIVWLARWDPLGGKAARGKRARRHQRDHAGRRP